MRTKILGRIAELVAARNTAPPAKHAAIQKQIDFWRKTLHHQKTKNYVRS